MHIILADDHTLFRETLCLYINRARPDVLVTLLPDYQALDIKMTELKSADLVLMDLYMPGMVKYEGLKDFREKWPDTPLAIISGVADKAEIEAVLKLGACAFFPKTLTGNALLKAIELVLAGEKFVPVDYEPPVRDLQMRTVAKALDAANIHLTPREHEVLSLLMKGASNQDIASALDLQVVTVKLHIRGLCRKLSAKNRTHAAMRAVELHLNVLPPWGMRW